MTRRLRIFYCAKKCTAAKANQRKLFGDAGAKRNRIQTQAARTGGFHAQIASEFSDRTGRADYSDGDPDKESRLYVLVHTDAPACLVEMAFISNDEEAAALLSDAAWQERYARAINRGVTDYATLKTNAE